MSDVQMRERRMISTELMGGHTHKTLAGTKVHVWKRGPQFMARGSISGKRFGENLGTAEVEATVRLRQILTDVDGGTYVRASEARKRLIATTVSPRMLLRLVVSDFLAEKRKALGEESAGDYKSRLMPVLAFAEQAENAKRWHLAMDIDREFIVQLRAFLFQYSTTRNGRPGGTPRPLGERQIYNVMQCLRTLLAWATKPAVRKLPAGWENPLTGDLLGSRPAKDPLRLDKLPLDARVRLVQSMDRWQLCTLALFTILPMRPDEAAGLLVSDVNFKEGWLEFGERLRDINFTKEGTAFKVPFPPEFASLLRVCIAGRTEGPLLRSRPEFEAAAPGLSSLEELRQLYQEAQRTAPPDSIQSAHDRKMLFRRLLRDLGGVTEDIMNRDFKKLASALGISNGVTLYTLRSSVTTAMKNANLSHLDLRYLTSHSTNDILNVYATLNPVGAMRQYFETIEPLLSAIEDRAQQLGLPVEQTRLPEPQYTSAADRLTW